ncbi:hypothetical protein HJ012_23750 [Vibrio parahaemolyticus]|nr:hypothetical protein [Vibrio parahaemolyticus]
MDSSVDCLFGVVLGITLGGGLGGLLALMYAYLERIITQTEHNTLLHISPAPLR